MASYIDCPKDLLKAILTLPIPSRATHIERIARCSTLEIPFRIVIANPFQREHCALRVCATNNPTVPRYFEGAIKDLTATGLHTFRSRVDVTNAKIVEPE